MEKRKTAIWIFFWTFWTMVTTIVWQCSPAIVKYAGTSLHASAGQVLHGCMLAGIDVLVILIGRSFRSRKMEPGDSLAFVFKSWLLLLAAGISFTILVVFFLYFQVSDLYTAMFPIMRNEIPMVIGIWIGILIASLLSSNNPLNEEGIIAEVIWGISFSLLIIPFVFNSNMFFLNNKSNPLIFTVLFLIGYCSTPSQLKKSRQLLIFTVCGGASLIMMGLMPYISTMNYYNLSTAARFTTIANPLLVIACYALINLLYSRQMEFSLFAWITYLFAITSVTTPSMSHVLKEVIIRHAGHSTIRLIIWSSAFSVALLILCLSVAAIVQHTNKYLNLSNNIDNFFEGLNDVNDSHAWIKQKKTQVLLLIRKKKEIIISAGVAYVLALLSMILINVSFQNEELHVNIFMMTLFYRQTLLILNAVIYFSLIMFLWAILRRYYVALGSSILLIAAWVIANRIKILSRSEPILPSELKMLDDWGNLLGMAGRQVLIGVLIFIVAAILVIIYLEKRNNVQPLSLKRSIVWLLVFPVIMLSSMGWNQHNSALDTLLRGFGDDYDFFNQLYGAQSNGPLMQFLNNIDVDVMDKPSDYSKSEMEKIRRRYEKKSNAMNLTRHNNLNHQTIIFNLSESFADPRRVPEASVKKNPIPQIDELKSNNTSGLMLSSGYGGGTANMEYMTLTGFALSVFSPTLGTPYTQLVNSLSHNPSIAGIFHHSSAIHPYYGTFYSRKTVYKKFGIDKFFSLDSKYKIRHKKKIGSNPYLSDETAYMNVLDQLNRQKSGQFIQLTTMQNHMPYDQNFYKDHGKFGIKSTSGINENSLMDYTAGINYTDIAVSRFIKQLDKYNRPITVVFYGDHLPGNIYGNSMVKHGLILHETDYFIYSNKYAREHGATQKLTSHTQVVDPNDFIALVAEQTNSKVNWYQAMLTDVLHQLPAFALNTGQHTKIDDNGRTQFVDEHGKFVSPKHWTKKQKQLWHDYKLVQYDVTAGKQYLVRDGQLK